MESVLDALEPFKKLAGTVVAFVSFGHMFSGTILFYVEALTDILLPYKELVGTLAGILTMCQMLSGTLICYDIYKQGSTRGIPLMPFTGSLVMSILNLKYGFILHDDIIIRVNFFGIAISIIYIMVFLNHTEEKVRTWMGLWIWGVFSTVLITYAQMEDPKVMDTRFGTIVTAFVIYLNATRLFGIKEIIEEKSTKSLPFPMILSGFVATFMWLLYGSVLKNKFLVMQNMVAFVLCAIQLSLYVIYPYKPRVKKTH